MVTPDRPVRALPPADAVTTAPGFVFRNATVVSVDPAIGTLENADVLVVGDTIAAVGPSLDVPAGHGRDRFQRRHRDARHDRHAPAHVADAHARLRRRLDAHQLLLLLLPRVGPGVPPGGGVRGQPARRARLPRRRSDDHAGLVAWPAHHRSRRGRASTRSNGSTAGSSSPMATWPKGRGNGRRARSSGTSSAAVSTAGATCCAGRWPSTSPAIRSSPRDRPSPWPANWTRASPRTAGYGARPRTQSIQLMAEHGYLTDRVTHVHVASLSEDSYQRIAASGGARLGGHRERVQCRAGLLADRAAAQVRDPDLAVGGHQLVVVGRHVLGDARDAQR